MRSYLASKRQPKLIACLQISFKKKKKLTDKSIWAERYQISWSVTKNFIFNSLFSHQRLFKTILLKNSLKKRRKNRKKNFLTSSGIKVKTQALCFSLTSNSTFNFKGRNSRLQKLLYIPIFSPFSLLLKPSEKNTAWLLVLFYINFLWNRKTTGSCGKKFSVNFGAV